MNPPEVRQESATAVHRSTKGQQAGTAQVKRDKPNTLKTISDRNGGR